MDRTHVYICTNGYVSFDTTGTYAYDNTETSTGNKIPFAMPFNPLSVDAYSTLTLPEAYAAPNFVVQDPYTGSDKIYYETRGTAPNRSFVVQYRVPSFYRTTAPKRELYDYEVIFYETSNEILFQYKAITNNIGYSFDPYITNGAAATVGIQGSGTVGTSYQTGKSNILWATPSMGAYSGKISNSLAVKFTKTKPKSSATATAKPFAATTTTTPVTTTTASDSGGGCMAFAFQVNQLLLLLMFSGLLFVVSRGKPQKFNVSKQSI